jgi:hypothetical protein
MSSLNNAVPYSELGKALSIIAACYDAKFKDVDKRSAEQQVTRGTPFDLINTADCGLEFGLA